ncbi:MAG: Gfo/Idh/MocA family oxidoreductase [Verrucomicrobiota bacterium]
MNPISRRNFLKHTSLAAAGLSLSARSWADVPGANGDIRVAIIGFNSRGQAHINEYKKMSGVRIVALCDVDKNILDGNVAKLKNAGLELEGFSDLRKLIDSKNIDVISIATPNHWHSLASIWAMQAGKDVYVEKPISHNIFEGRKTVEAARKYKKICQTGTQARSSEAIRQAVDYVRSGKLGKIQIARGFCYKPRPSIGQVSEALKVPASVDYDLWCGPAPMDPLRRAKFHYDWHWFWNTGNGDLGNQGVHQMDIARWFLGEKLSPRVFAVGGRLGYVDDGETPNTLLVYHDYEKAPLIFEVRGLPEKSGSKKMDKHQGVSIGVIIECEKGSAVVTSDYRSAVILDKDSREMEKFETKIAPEEAHFTNFIQAVRNRKSSGLNADILEGHFSAALCHCGNISYRVGHPASLEEIRAKIKSEKGATEAFNRMVSHLEANDVDLEKTKLTMGEILKVDTKAENFSNHSAANKLLTRDYRKPFVVPEKV